MRYLFLFLIVYSTSIMAQDFKTPLPVGTPAPAFSGVDQHGQQVSLEAALQSGPVVLLFYRGSWCPVCTRHLKDLQSSLETLQDRYNAQVIVVTPEVTNSRAIMVEKVNATFPIISDTSFQIQQDYHVDFQVTDENVPGMVYKWTLNNAREANAGEAERLPVPATYIIDRQGKIQWVHYNPDYKDRATPEDIMSVLSRL